jgi:hypothetical protein
MDAQDKAALINIIREYPVQEVVAELLETVEEREDELVDQGLSDKAKPLSLVAWHLGMLDFED